ncbi:MAG: hypothetical protein JST04_16315 [Bdellovibrionales bacterium]|nr:hypothetical protein [Bdellovibrionales bacterium]
MPRSNAFPIHSLIFASLLALLATSGRARAYELEFSRDCDPGYLLGDDPNFDVDVRAFLRETVDQGFVRLRDANPRLSDAVERRLARAGTITLECPLLRDIGDRTVAKSRARGFFAKPRLYLGDISFLVVDRSVPKLRDEQIRIFGAESFAERVQFTRNTVFHEFLHLAKIRNQSNAAHNAVTGKDHDVERDLVYACADVAYPTKPGFDLPIDHALARETCANGKP